MPIRQPPCVYRVVQDALFDAAVICSALHARDRPRVSRARSITGDEAIDALRRASSLLSQLASANLLDVDSSSTSGVPANGSRAEAWLVTQTNAAHGTRRR